eukprot:ctg_4205.g496
MARATHTSSHERGHGHHLESGSSVAMDSALRAVGRVEVGAGEHDGLLAELCRVDAAGAGGSVSGAGRAAGGGHGLCGLAGVAGAARGSRAGAGGGVVQPVACSAERAGKMEHFRPVRRDVVYDGVGGVGRRRFRLASAAPALAGGLHHGAERR